ncbi:MAG: DUF3108 domain-containing protein [Pseudomonadota bacterium]
MKKMFKSLCCAALATLIAGCLSAIPAEASYEKTNPRYSVDQEHKLALKYDVYAGGFKALNASLVMDLDKKAYDMALTAETQGFIGSLFPWSASFNTAGHAEDGTLYPTVYTERSTWRKGVKITEMDYAPDGKILKTTTQSGGKTVTDRDIDDVLAGDTMDLLTGALVMLQNAGHTRKCTGNFPVFDGKRRFNVTLTDDGTEILPPSRYSRFEGEAMRCMLKVEPVAGFKKKDSQRGWMAVQNHTEERQKPPTLWLARMKDSGQIVPVRMEIASAYGSVVAHLSGGTDK